MILGNWKYRKSELSFDKDELTNIYFTIYLWAHFYTVFYLNINRFLPFTTFIELLLKKLLFLEKKMPSNETRIYVGNLPPDIRTKDIEDLFYKYGKIVFIDLKNRRGPPFAFVEFDDPRDADDAGDYYDLQYTTVTKT